MIILILNIRISFRLTSNIINFCNLCATCTKVFTNARRRAFHSDTLLFATAPFGAVAYYLE